MLKQSKKTTILIYGYAGLFAFLYSTCIYADEYHYNNVLIGDRAAGMAGAYTAIADDASGLFYNPAGIIYGESNDISGSMNALQVTNTVYIDALGSGIDWKRESSSLIPNYFGVIQPLGKGSVGFSYAVTDFSQEDQDQSLGPLTSYGIDRYHINFNNQDNTYNFGPSYALAINKDLSIGATLYMHYRKQERIYNVLSEYNAGAGGDYASYSEYVSIEETGIRPVLGAMWSPQDQWSLGMTISQTILTSSTRRQQTSAKLQNDSVVTRTDFKSSKKRALPLTLTLGAAYFYNDSLLYSADFSYYSKTSSSGFVDRPSNWNLALGTEYYLNSAWALRGGIYTNRANTPTVKSGSTNQLDHVDLLGMSFSVSHFSRNSSLTVGFTYNSGSGDAQVNTADPQEIQKLNMQTSSVFMSASYSY